MRLARLQVDISFLLLIRSSQVPQPSAYHSGFIPGIGSRISLKGCQPAISPDIHALQHPLSSKAPTFTGSKDDKATCAPWFSMAQERPEQKVGPWLCPLPMHIHGISSDLCFILHTILFQPLQHSALSLEPLSWFIK